MKNRRIVVAIVCCLWAAMGWAQNGFNMPYSQFGVGSGDPSNNMPQAVRIGGVAYTLMGNNFVNPFNPASYAGIERESFVFDMGLAIQVGTLRDEQNSLVDADGNLAYLSFALPITKWWKVAGGLLPYSMVDYQTTAQQDDPDFGMVKTIYDGTGSVNQIFVGSGFNLLGNPVEGRSLQVGFNVNYLIGNIDRAISYSFSGVDSTYYVNSRRYKRTKVNNVLFDFGVLYRQPLSERDMLSIGITYKPKREMHVKDMALVYTYHSTDESLIDTIFPEPNGDPEYRSGLDLDHTVGIGVSWERRNRWRIAADATFAGWAGLKYTEDNGHSILGRSSLTYGPYSRYAIGFERVGDRNANSYWRRIGWSAGVHTEQGTMYLTLEDQQKKINEWGCGMGMTMPMRKGRSLLTLSISYSSLGQRDLLQRNLFSFGISVSTSDRWFFKRKFN